MPEKGIIRGYLIELFVRTHSQDLAPLDPLRPPPSEQAELYDIQEQKAEVQVNLNSMFWFVCFLLLSSNRVFV